MEPHGVEHAAARIEGTDIPQIAGVPQTIGITGRLFRSHQNH